MDKQSYAKYLFQLMGEEVEDDELIEEMLYGYFQMYMPSGKGVEATFKPLEDGDAYLQRINRIYEILDHSDFAGETVPGYFNSKAKDVPPTVLKQHGEQFILALKQLLVEYVTDERDSVNEAVAYLSGIEEILIVPHGQLDSIRQSHDSALYETIFDVVSEHKNYDEPIEVLNEAYYSIACDYWLSYYLQWHRYKLKGDPFAPYFELFALGYSAVFSDNKLYIGS
ncbi:hypothetical protein J40TS1_03930 [Paenibacillus montaniterrae]|uniref:Uncharacterized protein n=1 Tax=Paenibacillus montaniterrae TaxID=429341 RepID=A0A920CV90_9BACL|nr:hypothetical protein [Paenibacillus montaniterrae]GIP14751.1 hypothetical protein J40TS1_03930 [Paenibacillus montaniterrae]